MVQLSLRRASGASVAVDFNDAPSYMCGPASRGDCDGDPLNGCETEIATSPVHCGACGRACSPYAATGACVAGQCTIASCQADRGDCDRSAATGCEAWLQSDSNNCGACGRSCALPNVQSWHYPCANGVCAAVVYAPVLYSQNRSCMSGWENCDGDASTGCEIDLTTNRNNCGRCGIRCHEAEICANGYCQPVNAHPYGPPAIDLSRGARIDLPYSLQNDTVQSAPRTCRGDNRRDVFFGFTLTQRELVSADSFGTGQSPLLYFMYPSTLDRYTGTAPGEVTCDSGGGCAVAGSRVVALLNPGRYMLVVAADDAQSIRTGTIHFMHLPVSGTATSVGLPASFTSYFNTFQGDTSGASTALASCADATGPEATFWWMTCPELPAATPLRSNTCGSGFDTVLSYANTADSGGACSGPSGVRYCAQGAMVSTDLPAGANLHTLTVDGRQGASGRFNLYIEIGDSTW